MKSLVQIAKEEIESNICQHCGGGKQNGKPFCGMCVQALPDNLRIKVYSSTATDIQRAEYYDECKQYLNCESKIPKGIKKPWKKK